MARDMEFNAGQQLDGITIVPRHSGLVLDKRLWDELTYVQI